MLRRQCKKQPATFFESIGGKPIHFAKCSTKSTFCDRVSSSRKTIDSKIHPVRLLVFSVTGTVFYHVPSPRFQAKRRTHNRGFRICPNQTYFYSRILSSFLILRSEKLVSSCTCYGCKICKTMLMSWVFWCMEALFLTFLVLYQKLKCRKSTDHRSLLNL